MKILIVGDIHGRFADFSRHLNEINHDGYDYILACGDFGYWPNDVNFNDIKIPEKTKIYFCDGNHERHDLLEKLTNNEIHHNVFYMKRGSVLTIKDKNILFFGGADSIDRNWRTPGIDWFYQENISLKDMYNLPETNIDIVISHTCPKYFNLNKAIIQEKITDSNREYLSQILDKYNPTQWYFGHWHEVFNGIYKNTEYFGLNMLPNFGWYKVLEI